MTLREHFQAGQLALEAAGGCQAVGEGKPSTKETHLGLLTPPGVHPRGGDR